MGQRKRSSKIREKSKEADIRAIPQMDKSLWKESKWEDVDEKSMELCDKFERGGLC